MLIKSFKFEKKMLFLNLMTIATYKRYQSYKINSKDYINVIWSFNLMYKDLANRTPFHCWLKAVIETLTIVFSVLLFIIYLFTISIWERWKWGENSRNRVPDWSTGSTAFSHAGCLLWKWEQAADGWEASPLSHPAPFICIKTTYYKGSNLFSQALLLGGWIQWVGKKWEKKKESKGKANWFCRMNGANAV